MTSFQMKCFISVENHRNFTKAAEDCHVVQATISRQISALEEELGCKLFERDSHGVHTTPAGDMLAYYAPVFLEYQKNICDQVRNAYFRTQKSLRIGVGPYEHLLLRKPLQAMHLDGTELEIDLTSYTYKVLLTRYRNKVLDLILCNDLCAAQMPDYHAHPVCHVKWQVVASRQSTLWELPYDEQQVLNGQRLITLVNDQYDTVRKYCYSQFMSNRMVETNFLTTLLELVQANLGVAIVPPFVKPMLPPDVVMRDLLAVPFVQTFYAMFSPTIEKGNLEQLKAYLNSAASDFS